MWSFTQLRNLQRVKHVCRLFHTSQIIFNEAAPRKASLANLRKATGFSITQCKKALEKFPGDIDKAEAWLYEQAAEQGWAKASKLQHRAMSQGLIGVLKQDSMGIMVEVNCETDFVARNEKFKGLVEKITCACFSHVQRHSENKVELTKETLSSVPTDEGSVGDSVALVVGSVGENMVVRRAAFFRAPENSLLSMYVHAIGESPAEYGGCMLGRYASFVITKPAEPITEAEIKETAAAEPMADSETVETTASEEEEVVDDIMDPVELGKRLSQQIVGMHPLTLGDDEVSAISASKGDETRLLYQEYQFNSDKTVKEVLKENDISVVDFLRYECGEELPEDAMSS